MKSFFNTFSSRILLFSVAGLFLAATPAFLGETLSARLDFIVNHWDGMEAEADLDYDKISSWVPESGVRGKYAIAKSILSKNTLQGIVGEEVYLSGPHMEDMNFKKKTSFGHYNPVFVTKLEGMLKVILGRKAFVRAARPFYEKNVKNLFRTYYMAYDVAANNQSVMEKYRQAVANADESSDDFLAAPSYALQESFREFSDDLSSQGYDIYESFTCPGFWVRRSIDGTADEFYDLLIYVMGVFDKDFLK